MIVKVLSKSPTDLSPHITWPIRLLCPDNVLGPATHGYLSFYINERNSSLASIMVSSPTTCREEELSSAGSGLETLFLTTYDHGTHSVRRNDCFRELKKCSKFLADLYRRTRQC